MEDNYNEKTFNGEKWYKWIDIEMSDSTEVHGYPWSDIKARCKFDKTKGEFETKTAANYAAEWVRNI